MTKTTEQALGLAVMRLLADHHNGEATLRTLIRELPNWINLTEEDRLPSATRPNEEMWEQRVRNLKSHSNIEGNVIAEGYVEHIPKGRYRLTQSGRSYLEAKGLV